MHRTDKSLGRRLSSASLRYQTPHADVNDVSRRWPPTGKTRGRLGQRGDESVDSAAALGSEAERIARVEAVLFLARQPLSSRKLSRLADLADGTEARTLVRRLKRHLDERGAAFQIEEVGGGFQLLTRTQFAPWLQRLHTSSSQLRLSAPAMETLAVVAYRGTVVRAEIESIRGVQCGEILRQLMERDLVRIAGRSEELGRPYRYATTKRFLQVFGLRSLEDLPRAEQMRAGVGVSEKPAQSVVEIDSPDRQDIGIDEAATSFPEEFSEMVTDMTHPTIDESTDVPEDDPRGVPVNEHEDETTEDEYEDEYEDVEEGEEEDDDYEYIYEDDDAEDDDAEDGDAEDGDAEDGDAEDGEAAEESGEESEEDEEYEDGDEYEYVDVVDEEEDGEGEEDEEDGEEVEEGEEEDDEYEYEYEEVDEDEDEDDEEEDKKDGEEEVIKGKDDKIEVDDNGEWVEADDDEEEDDEYEYEYEDDEEE